MHPLHDEYAEILIPNGTQVIAIFPTDYSNEAYTYLSTNERIGWQNITKAVIYSNSTIAVIVKTPTIRVKGAVQFENSVIDYPCSNLMNQGESLTLHGEVGYDVPVSDEKGR